MANKIIMKSGNYGIYKVDGLEYACGKLETSRVKLISKNPEKIKEGFTEHKFRNWKNEEESSYHKLVSLNDLEDIYRVKYYMIVNGKERRISGYNEKEFITYSEKEEEEFKTYREDIVTWLVYVPISKIEKFVELKEHIGLYDYRGEERKDLPNTKETIEYISTTFPN